MNVITVNPGQVWRRSRDGRGLRILTVITRPDSPTLVIGQWVDDDNPNTNIEVLGIEELTNLFAAPERLPDPVVQYWWFNTMYPGRLDQAAGPYPNLSEAHRARHPNFFLVRGVTTFALVEDQ